VLLSLPYLAALHQDARWPAAWTPGVTAEARQPLREQGRHGYNLALPSARDPNVPDCLSGILHRDLPVTVSDGPVKHRAFAHVRRAVRAMPVPVVVRMAGRAGRPPCGMRRRFPFFHPHSEQACP